MLWPFTSVPSLPALLPQSAHFLLSASQSLAVCQALGVEGAESQASLRPAEGTFVPRPGPEPRVRSLVLLSPPREGCWPQSTFSRHEPLGGAEERQFSHQHPLSVCCVQSFSLGTLTIRIPCGYESVVFSVNSPEKGREWGVSLRARGREALLGLPPQVGYTLGLFPSYWL